MTFTFLTWFKCHKFSFFRFNENLLALDQIDNLFSSVFNMLAKQSASLWDRKTLVSSVNKINGNILDALFISLMQNKNNKGPKIEPCGTSHKMLVREET